ncbi:MAG: type IV secretion system DNA-binding domain-containing protein [Candidatus Liptonbacteria bacterium]|nr:type IV secretion system DNA-binding domain-containing protein [Candidatus Liptonbacteria bacterium]
MGDINLFAETNFRNKHVRFGIKRSDRRQHMYLIGRTGVGKTKMMENMIINDIRNGEGIGLIDPHGEFAETILNFIPPERIDDVIYFNPSDVNYPVGFNPLEGVSGEYRHLIAAGVMSVFKKIWPDVWSARMEYILNNTLLALLEFPGSTILGIMRMLTEKEYRKKVTENLKDPVVKSFWENEFNRYTDRYAIEAVAAVQNKIGQLVSNSLIRNIIGQSKSTIDIRKIMDERKILIANLSHGRIGESNSALLGALFITKLQQAAMSRINIPEEKRQDFYLYIDEFQNFSTESFAIILSEARKYRLCLILAHQYIEQLDEAVKAAIFGNVGTVVCFRVGVEDAEFLEKELAPEFNASDLLGLGRKNIYIKLSIDGLIANAFSAEVLPAITLNTKPDTQTSELIISQSRRCYGVPSLVVEKKINEDWAGKEKIEERIERQFEQSSEKVLYPKDKKPIIIENLRKAIEDALKPQDDLGDLGESEEPEKNI